MLGIKNSMFTRPNALGQKKSNENVKPLGNKNSYAIDQTRMNYHGPPVFEQYRVRDHNDPKYQYVNTLKKKSYLVEKKHRFSRL